MSSAGLIPYYPTYQILDEVLAIKNYKKMILYIDLKNNLQNTYMEHSIVNILENSKRSRFLDTSIFVAVLHFLVWHKIYAIKRNIDIHFVIFFETGKSMYHKNILKEYKFSRSQDDLYGLERKDRDLFFETLQSNLKLIEKAINQIPCMTVIHLSNLEADFIPYYLTTRCLVPTEDDVCHLIYSNDHDMWQCLRDNVYIFSKRPGSKKILREQDVMESFFSQPCEISKEYLPLFMAILGDPGDDVPGVSGIGKKRIFSFAFECIKLVGSINDVYEKVMNNKPIFLSEDLEKTQNKYLKTVINEEVNSFKISMSLKLVSFELLSREFDEPKRIEILERKKKIDNILYNNQKTQKDILFNALVKCDIDIERDMLDYLYL